MVSLTLVIATAITIALAPIPIIQANEDVSKPLVPIQLTSQEFYETMDRYDVIVDVRSASEWADGHIANATFVESLASFGDSGQVGTPADLAGCEYCDIVVYCRTGGRAGVALGHMIDAGFKGRLYNGLGVSQWTDAGYPLVSTDSVVPPCTTNQGVQDACLAKWQSYQGASSDGEPAAASIEPPITAPVAEPTSAALTRFFDAIPLAFAAVIGAFFNI